MENPGIVREILHSQDPNRIEAFIQWWSTFSEDISDNDIDLKYMPFNKNSEEYKQILAIHKAAKDLANAIGNCTKAGGGLDRLSHYLNVPDLNEQLIQVLNIYGATCSALDHQERTSTGGGMSQLTEIEKKKLRYLQQLFKRFFPELSISFNSENNLINKVGCHVLRRNNLSNRTDQAIRLKTLL